MATKRILIAEDEWMLAEQLRRNLTSEGYDVIGVVSSGEDVIAQAEQSRPDVVLMDIVLPGGIDGIAAAQQLQMRGVPVVYLTAYADRDVVERAQHTEPLGYVVKPAKPEELAAAIRVGLFRREQEQSRNQVRNSDALPEREGADQFRLMVDGVADVSIFTLDPNDRVNSWNRGAEKINGYTAREIVGKPYSILFTAEDREQGVPETELSIAESTGSADDTRWLLRADGERYWAEGILSAIRDENGQLTGYTKVNRDATEHKRTRDALEKTQDRLRIALKAARMGTWDWEIKTNRESLDDNLRELFGLRPDQNISTIEQFYSLIHPDDRASVVAAFDRTREEGVHLSTEFRVQRSDGGQRWLMDQGDVLLDEYGEPDRMSGACMDITQRREAEDALRESEERFRLFVNGVRDYALFQMDPDGRIVSWNSGAERVLGFSESDVVGQPSSVLFIPEDIARGEPRREIETALANGRSEDERWHIRKGGARFWSSGVVSPLHDATGRLRGFAKVMRDDTERRQASEQLRNSLEQKEALLKEIHHRVKNNLQVITSLLMLQSDAVDDETTRTMFEEAVNRVRTIGDIHELLYRSPDLARVDFGLYLRRLAHNLISFYGLDPHGTRVIVDTTCEALELASAIPCALIVNELLTNALKHAFPGGRHGEVRLSLHCESGQCVLRVFDDGVGLSSETAVEDTVSLGLKLVSVLARQLNGSFRLESGEGTRCVITFPASGSEAQVHN